jgi:hypothetical protein
MLLACLAVSLISCRDTIDPREATPPSQFQHQEASGPVTVLRLTCTFSFFNGEQGEVRCGEPGTGMKRVSRSAILPASSEYAAWVPDDLMRDTTTQTWTFIASVKNLLAQPIGTFDGTTAVGSKVVVTYGPVATRGTGDVWITNADGMGISTAPNQPYFNYPWIVQPQQVSPYREIKTHVQNTVTEVTIGIAIFTDFPAEQNVAMAPPDSSPAWLHADSMISPATARYASRHVRNIVLLAFDSSTSLSDRQLVIAKVGGEVVGGVRVVRDDGLYIVRVNPGPSEDLFFMIDTLRSLPHVIAATPDNIFDLGRDSLEQLD